MEAVEANYPLESIVDELVKTELQYEALSAKSAKRLQMKLAHFEILRGEMLQRHANELREITIIIDSYKKPLELRDKSLRRKEEKLAELKGQLGARTKAIASLGRLPPPVNEIVGEEEEEERIENEIVPGVKTYSMPR
jgi:hypothetical protein